MNPERRFPLAEKVAGFIIRIQLWIESFFPVPEGRILDVDELSVDWATEWKEELTRQINDTTQS